MMTTWLANTDIPGVTGGGGGAHGSLGLTLFVILATAAIVSAAFRKFRIEAIPGYLLAGAIVGPYAIGLVKDIESVEQVSSLAIILLMFTIGLHLDANSMRRGMVHILAVGIASTLVFVGLFWACMTLVGMSRAAGLAVALAASVSSTAVLVRTLMTRRELHSSYGRVTLGVSIVQDLLSVVVLAMLPILQVWANGTMSGGGDNSGLPEWARLMLEGVKGLTGVFLLFVAGRFLLPKLLQATANLGSQELLLVASAAIALAAAWWTSYIGFSAEMGAFLAGFLLGSTPFRYQLSGQLAPMRDLLMAIFFTAVGLKVDPSQLLANWWIILIATAAVILCKSLAIGGAAYLAGMTAPTALIAAIYLANAGEFTLVVLAQAERLGVVNNQQQSVAIAMVILSLVATPLLTQASHGWASKLARIPLSPWSRSNALRDAPTVPVPRAAALSPEPLEPEPDPDHHEGGETLPRAIKPKHVIIAGYGPVGRAIADWLAVQHVDFTIVELNSETVHRQATSGRRVVYGDITNHEVLEQAGVHWADAIVITIPDETAAIHACQVIREFSPHVFIAARVSFLSGKFMALQLGADVVTVEEVATASAMEKEFVGGLQRHLERRTGSNPVR